MHKYFQLIWTAIKAKPRQFILAILVVFIFPLFIKLYTYFDHENKYDKVGLNTFDFTSKSFNKTKKLPDFIRNDKFRKVFKWINFQQIENYKFEFQHNFPKCPLCKYQIQSNPNAPKRDDSYDISLSFLMGNISGVVPYIQTLRSTGSKAQIVIFVDDETGETIYLKTGSFMKDCGVHIINIGNIPKNNNCRYFVLNYVKYAASLLFLQTHPFFDRVLVTDLSDVIFQGNPFLAVFPNNETFISSPEYENNGIQTSHWYEEETEIEILKMLTEIRKDVSFHSFRRKESYYNSGVFLTTYHLAVSHFFNVFDLLNDITHSQWDRLEELNEKLEETNVNIYAINTYLKKNNSITVLNDGLNNELFLLTGRQYEKGQQFPNFKYKGNYVLLFHLVHLDKEYCNSISQKCSPIFDFTPYYHC
ncbi:hypothetical protein TRFO_18394 [Tritrichomonas foetus]|uniref:Nucleotide-diphospho-sugar transferase domain-containing protein n=1 Tax=Tritrichomonas foetus TaxID=1144522 RepID=A0A1J4KLW3_9EUKA|nr:hypothetical protein TRFO_18394 [Tritrichomonas foetus]|eukprot:OHT11928.1 hypothetical protein TRFO_18394 [Tritrichomonas foetus]